MRIRNLFVWPRRVRRINALIVQANLVNSLILGPLTKSFDFRTCNKSAIVLYKVSIPFFTHNQTIMSET